MMTKELRSSSLMKPNESPAGYAHVQAIERLRFTPETIRRLGVAARKYGMSRTAYTELALQDRFKKDGVQ
jgi:hypothetical protein